MSLHEPSSSRDSRPDPLSTYESIISNRQVGWYSERPFLRELGTGGQGIVYLSVRRGAASFSLPIALKLFSPKRFTSVKSYQSEMRRTARVAARVARIQHDNLIDVHNFLSQQGIHLLEMEWLDGYDLQRLLRSDSLEYVRFHTSDQHWQRLNESVVTAGEQQSRMKPVISVGVVRECLRGLAALHRAGIVHSDLKPSNIMLKRSGNVKLIDIGSAYEIRSPPQGLPCTPLYAAPEVLLGQLGSPLSDLASLGYVLIEMLAGVQPFAGLSITQLVEAKQTIVERLPYILPIEEFAYSEMLIKLIRGLVDPDPARRFASAEAADLGDDGTSGFLNQLVKGDFASEYAVSIRSWVEKIDEDFFISTNHRSPGVGTMLSTTQFEPPGRPASDSTASQVTPDDEPGDEAGAG